MRIMGLDVGDRYIGVAVSDDLGVTAQGIRTLNRNQCLNALKAIIKEYGIGSIVVGVPKMLDGTVGIQGKKVLKFVEELKNAIPLPVILWDERLTTVAAEKALLEANLKRKKRKGLRDKVSAALILQGYLDSLRQ
jgi:putative Holliday junction resolvase